MASIPSSRNLSLVTASRCEISFACLHHTYTSKMHHGQATETTAPSRPIVRLNPDSPKAPIPTLDLYSGLALDLSGGTDTVSGCTHC